MESRIETLLDAAINEGTIENFEPQSRVESYLLSCVNGTGAEDDLPEPVSRVDALLYTLAKEGGGRNKNTCADYIRLMPNKTVQMFYGCEDLFDASEFLDYDCTSNSTSFKEMFYNCTNLVNVPLFDTSNGLVAHYMFSGCTSLKVVPAFDFRNVSFANLPIFTGTIEECYVKNIRVSCDKFASMSKLSAENWIYLLGQLVKGANAYTFTIGSSNMSKINSVYVKLIEITDEMRAEDDLIDNKYPFEVCESTDSGAIKLTTEYVMLKNWTLK